MMADASEYEKLMEWCTAVLGQAEVLADQSREHAGLRAGAYHLKAGSAACYVKVHRDRAHWESEVHAYEHWAAAFGGFAPRLLAVREEEPLALILSDLAGRPLEDAGLPIAQQSALWRRAGQDLAKLHALEKGVFFGACRRDGSPAARPFGDPLSFMTDGFDDWLERGRRIRCLSDAELALAEASMRLIPAFAGEAPVPCHRDYCPPNWLTDAQGHWLGVIDFEFSGWDVRTADFSRFPGWEWLEHPQLLAAFCEGYGCRLDEKFQQQLLVSQVLYALGAVVWGMENEYRIFATEGRHALEILAPKVRKYAAKS